MDAQILVPVEDNKILYVTASDVMEYTKGEPSKVYLFHTGPQKDKKT